MAHTVCLFLGQGNVWGGQLWGAPAQPWAQGGMGRAGGAAHCPGHRDSSRDEQEVSADLQKNRIWPLMFF